MGDDLVGLFGAKFQGLLFRMNQGFVRPFSFAQEKAGVGLGGQGGLVVGLAVLDFEFPFRNPRVVVVVEDCGGDEDGQIVDVLFVLFVPEQFAQAGDVAQVRHLAPALAGRGGAQAGDDHCVAAVEREFSVERASGRLRHLSGRCALRA